MSQRNTADSIILKEYITQNDYEEISKLEKLCQITDSVNLKLELDYKMSLTQKKADCMNKINEFLYYHNGELVSYLGICSFGGNVYELNGLTHPDYRRKGYFKKLFQLAVNECKEKGKKNILLLSDAESESGTAFIKSVGGIYHFSENRMKQVISALPKEQPSIYLRRAEEKDIYDIAKQNALHFNTSPESEVSLLKESPLPEGIFMIELEDKIIGKIQVDFNEDSAFICGFGIQPEYRNKGFGRAALKQAVAIIYSRGIRTALLDVESKNDRALHLYKDCGFEEQSAMNYFNFSLQD